MFIPIWLVYLILFALLGGSMFMYGVLIDEQPNAGFFKKLAVFISSFLFMVVFPFITIIFAIWGVVQGVIMGVRESRK